MKDFLVLDSDVAVDIGPKNFNWDSGDQEWFYIQDGVWYIAKGTIWDGATLAPDGLEDPLHPSYPILWFPTLLHDLGYMALTDYDDFPYTRRQVDKLFLKYMTQVDFKYRKFYYRAVRWFGGVFSELGIWYRKIFNKQRNMPTHLSECDARFDLQRFLT